MAFLMLNWNQQFDKHDVWNHHHVSSLSMTSGFYSRLMTCCSWYPVHLPFSVMCLQSRQDKWGINLYRRKSGSVENMFLLIRLDIHKYSMTLPQTTLCTPGRSRTYFGKKRMNNAADAVLSFSLWILHVLAFVIKPLFTGVHVIWTSCGLSLRISVK